MCTTQRNLEYIRDDFHILGFGDTWKASACLRMAFSIDYQDGTYGPLLRQL